MDFASLNNDRGKVFVDVTYENALLCAGRLSEEYVAGGETLAELRETGQRLERAVKVAWKKLSKLEDLAEQGLRHRSFRNQDISKLNQERMRLARNNLCHRRDQNRLLCQMASCQNEDLKGDLEMAQNEVIRCEEWLVEWVASTLLVQRDNHNGLPVRQASVGTDEDIVAPTSTRDESGSAE